MSNKNLTNRALKLLSQGFSVFPVDSRKIPSHREEGKLTWKGLQQEPLTPDQVKESFNQHSSKANQVGYATGYNDIFVIDVDLKVLPNEERQPLWNEYISTLRESVDLLDSKIAIRRTKNFGYHLTYKVKQREGSKVLAKPENNDRALFETRAIGGYAIAYEDSYNGLEYGDISMLTEQEHSNILAITSTYDCREKEPLKIEVKQKAPSFNESLSPWQDYNEKTSIFDIIPEFKIVKKLSNKVLVRRPGAESFHSGSVFNDSGCLYLFSTGSIYPPEKLITPFQALAIKEYSSDFSKCASDLYHKGFGARMIPITQKLKKPQKADKYTGEFPIEVFPSIIQNYIKECSRTLGHSPDYMASAMLWLTSLVVGNSMKLNLKRGYSECGVVWISIVGQAGVGKTPAIRSIINPLLTANSKEIKDYRNSRERFIEYESLSDDEKEYAAEVKPPKKKQFIVNDVTIEALTGLHEESQNAVGVFKDELAGWIKDMNKYRTGGDLEFWLSSFSNSPAFTTRKTAKEDYIHSPIIPVLGGIQPSIIPKIMNEDMAENGFVDRLLFCYPNVQVEHWTIEEIDENLLTDYNTFITAFFDFINNEVIEHDNEGEINSVMLNLSKEASGVLKTSLDEITDKMNSDKTQEGYKSLLPKQKTYLPRFALLLHAINCFSDGEDYRSDVSKESVESAKKLTDYFTSMAQKVFNESAESKELISKSLGKKPLSTQERFKLMHSEDLDIKQAATLLNVSTRTIRRWMKTIENDSKTKKP